MNTLDSQIPAASAEMHSAHLSPTRPSLLLSVRDLQNSEAWEQFVELYTPLIYGHCQRRGLQPADSADVTQEAMKAIAQAIQNFDYDRSRGSFRGWLLAVTRSKLNNFFAKQHRQPKAVGETELFRSLEHQTAESADNAEWDEEYRKRLLQWACDLVRDQFQSTTWQAFMLTTIEQLPVPAVAERLNLSAGAVYIAKCRVAAQIRQKIREASEDQSPWA